MSELLTKPKRITPQNISDKEFFLRTQSLRRLWRKPCCAFGLESVGRTHLYRTSRGLYVGCRIYLSAALFQ